MVEYNDSIISKRRKGDSNDPFLQITETLQIINGKTVLREIPNRFEKVQVTITGTTMYEIEDGELTSTLYKVDYSEGVVFFHTTHNNKSVTFTYLGEGRHFFPSSAVWITNDTNGIQTAKDKFNSVDSELLAQKNRVNNLITATPQPSEASDIRVDKNGSTYVTAKTRIDAEQKKIEDAYLGKNGVNYTSLKDRFDKTDDKIGDLSALSTTTKTNLVTAFNEQATNLNSSLSSKASKTDIVTPKRHIFGGQLAKLKESLSNPLEQFTGVVFVGDSITWGRTLPTNGVVDPRDGTLSDPRDVFAAPSFVNLFKKYVGSQYFFDATPTLSNWSASPSGEAVVEYTTQHTLYPYGGDFTLTTQGVNMTVAETQSSSSITGYQLQLNDLEFGGGGYHSLKFNFTGDTFTLSFAIVSGEECFYDIYADGVKIGTYENKVGVNGFAAGNDQRRTHTIPYVRNKIVEIRTNRNGNTTIYKRLRLEGIIINKKVRITNQGIIGTTSNVYKTANLAGADGAAVGAYDNYVFCQMGTNDRIISTTKPKGENTFKTNLKLLLNELTPKANIILMCANPAANESPVTYSFNMQGVRNVVYRTAKEMLMDMIDNNAIFTGLDNSSYTADGLHPNELGHKMIANNIINSLEY
jgi:lysophospholipase L1-like esterase